MDEGALRRLHRFRMHRAVRMRMQMERGFTVVELIVVIVIAGVLSAIAVPRFVNGTLFRERGYYEELASALKAARTTAVASGCSVRFDLDGTGYAASQQPAVAGHCDPGAASWTVPVMLNDGTVLTGTPPPGVSASPSFTVVFDALGSTDLASNQTVMIGTRTLTIHAASGYVQAK